MKIKFTKDQKMIIEGYTQVSVNGDLYYYIPRWFKENEDGTHTVLRFDELPKDVIDMITEKRRPKLEDEFFIGC